MTNAARIAQVAAVVLVGVTFVIGQQKPFPVVSTVDEPTIAGRPVQLDAQGKLLPFPYPHDTGYS